MSAGRVPASRFACTTFVLYVKSRVCSPSPNTVAGRPSIAADMNSGITAAYADDGLWRGPNTLKYRSATPSRSPPRAYASTYCSLASLDAAYGERGRGSTFSTFGRTGVSPYTELELE